VEETLERRKILIADDDARFRDLVEELCAEMSLVSMPARDGVEALELTRNTRFALALIDLKMPRMGGLDYLSQVRENFPDLPVVIITGYGSIETAVEAMKLGAVDYIIKPASLPDVRRTISTIIESWRSSWRDFTHEEDTGRFGLIGRSKPMQSVYEKIEVMRKADNTVLIMGESGVGKELVARAIHFHGDRREEPFIPIDCSVLGLNIVESELFGHVKGAFTDAHYSRDGLLKLAGRGTVFFDEITEIPLSIQAKLLRAIQEREVRPVGSAQVERIEARIIAATNRELEKAVSQGTFREDLFYRLHVIPIIVPPLRERKDDIPLLVDHFLRKHYTEKRPVKGFTPEALKTLFSHEWPGNIRELENFLQQAIAFCSGEWIRPIDLPRNLRARKEPASGKEPSIKPLRELEKEAILKALEASDGNKITAARILGIGKTTLYEKLKKYMLE
jgi:DNA-binding NtrC family response regulator